MSTKPGAIQDLLLCANRDSLTGLYNRCEIVSFNEQHGTRESLILIDIDHFKKINDTFGHECGDLGLQAIAEAIRKAVRESDLAARWGGEEFLILLPKSEKPVALMIAERLREHLAKISGLGPDRITATMAVCETYNLESFTKALARADNALYEGKNAGRDRIMMAE